MGIVPKWHYTNQVKDGNSKGQKPLCQVNAFTYLTTTNELCGHYDKIPCKDGAFMLDWQTKQCHINRMENIMSEKILVVDDDVDTLRLVGIMLERQGYKILAAENGQRALEIAAKEKPDLILLDIMMPDIDGFEIARRIRDDSVIGDTPIIMFTAKVQVGDKVTGLEAGADVYLTKPTQPRELFAQVKVLLARAKKPQPIHLPKSADRGHMIGVLAAKGGLGVSTLVINLGISVYRHVGKDVLVADFRPGSSDVSLYLGYSLPKGLTQLLKLTPSEINIDIIKRELITHNSGIRLLMASRHPKDVSQIEQIEKLEAIARQLPYLSKFVILDLGASLLPATQSLAQLCDEIIIVVEPTPNNVHQTQLLMEDLYALDIGGDRTRIVLINRVRTGVQLKWEQVQDDLKHKIDVVFTPAPELAYQAAMTSLPMVIQQPNSITAQQFEKLASTITQHILH